MIKTIFHQYQRYQVCCELLKKFEHPLRILEIGSNEHLNLKKFLPTHIITFSDLEIPSSQSQNPNFIQLDGTDINLSNDEYDIVIALDVLEHVPPLKREKFIQEINRVAKLGAIVCFPTRDIGADFFELQLSQLNDSISGSPIPWVIEHFENGLPSNLEVDLYCEKSKLVYQKLFQGDISLFHRLLFSEIVSQKGEILYESFINISTFYNKFLFTQDISLEFNNHFRSFYLFGDANTFSLDFIGAGATGHFRQINTLLDVHEQILRLCDHKQLTLSNGEIARRNNYTDELREEIAKKGNYIDELHGEIVKKGNYIDELHGEIVKKGNYIDEVHGEIVKKDNYIDELHGEIAQIKQSFLYKISKFFHRMK